ncbi:MAG: hypothetical protein ABJB65_06530 [Chloroflexota bacterium]
MRRPTQIGLFVLLLLVVIGGSALAAARRPGANQTPSLLAGSHQPEASEAAEAPETPPTAAELAHAVDRLKAHGITADPVQLKTLAAKYGLGGAVRLMAWSKSTGKTVADLAAMRDGGTGWGQIAHELGVHPGIGSIMGDGHDKADKANDKADTAESPDESPEASPHD